VTDDTPDRPFRERTARTETDAGFDDALTDSARPQPALLLAWAPPDAPCADRARLAGTLRVGRSRQADWSIPDRRLSAEHFDLTTREGTVVVRDLDSRNGTFVNAVRLAGTRPLADQDVIRAGRCLFVFVADARELAAAAGIDAARHGFAGKFHSPVIVERLQHAAHTGRHLLLEGESGTGKELAARCAHTLRRPTGPFVAHNCARFATIEEAETTLFGVARGVFSGVEPRAGLLEQAEAGTLYLDEMPNLPARVQRSLLRFAEDGILARIGESRGRPADVWLLLGANRSPDEPADDRSLAPDLVARTHRLHLPPLRRRRADIPEIFLACLERIRSRTAPDEADLAPLLGADHFETLLLHDTRHTNVRFLEDLAAEIAARLLGTPRDLRRNTLARLFLRRLPDSPVLARFQDPEPDGPQGTGSPYERHRDEILAAYRDLGGNLSAVEDALRKRGIELHRRWIAVFLERWGVRIRKRRIPPPTDTPPR